MAVKELDIKPFSKHGYKSFKFEEIAFSISERVEPKQTDLKIYVGLEHLDADSIHIKRHGTPADVGGTKLKVYPGDLIFGKRRAYQRKAAVANFEGICSAHAMVLRANPKVIIPELFPFFIHSDQFMNRAIDISVGSLSPTINWGTLRTQEFLLPPKEQQAKLAELLWAGDSLSEQYFTEKRKIELISRIFVKRALRESKKKKAKFIKQEVPTEFQTSSIVQEMPQDWKVLSLNEVIENSQNGFAEGGRSAEEGIWQLRMNNVTKDCALDLTDVIRVPKERNLTRYKIEVGDVLFNNTNSEELVGKTVYFETIDREMVFSNHFTRLRANSKFLLQKYLQIWLKYHFKIGLFQRRCTKWIGQAAIQNENLLSLKILLPTIEEQKEIIKAVTSFEKNNYELEVLIDKSNKIQKQIINQIFGG